MAPVREVAFQLECFEWAEDRLDVAGRWQGLAGRRLGRPVLTVVTTAGKRKRLVAMPDGRFGPTETTWRAEFAWPGDPEAITSAELEVGGNVVVDLPLPDKRRRRRRKPAVEGDEALQAELGALRGQVERLRTELAGRERELMRLRAERENADEQGIAGPEAMTEEIERLARAEVDRLAAERDEAQERIERERSAAAADRTRAQADIDDLREAFAEAAEEAETVRERHRAELARLTDQLEAERTEVARLHAELAQPARNVPAGAAEAVGAADEAEEGALPPLTETARQRAAAPPTQPLAAAGRPAELDPTTAAEDPFTATRPVALDPPGPLRAGARPAAPDDLEAHEAVRSRVPAWVRAVRSRGAAAEPEAAEISSDRNGHVPELEAIPPPLRTAAAARARAGASVAARRSAVEVWAMRVLAVIVVAVLLIAFLLFLSNVA